jgi:uncharacterized membrane protein
VKNFGIVAMIFILIIVFLFLVNFKGFTKDISAGSSATDSLVSRLQGFNSGKLHVAS